MSSSLSEGNKKYLDIRTSDRQQAVKKALPLHAEQARREVEEYSTPALEREGLSAPRAGL
jgi:hypothetical protein